MEMKLRKLWPLFGAVCLGLTSTVFAHSNYQNSSSSSSTYGSSADSSSQSGQETYQRGTFREITPSAGPRVAHGADVFITADLIWWKTTQSGLEYGASGFINEGPTPPAIADVFNIQAPKGKLHTVGEDWSPGFKVGLGLNMSHDGWDLYAQYTWLHSSDKNSTTRPIAASRFGLVESGGGSGPFVIAQRANSDWDLHFNVIDLELGRNFYLSQFLTMRPFIGLKGTWQDQNWKSHYFDGDFTLRVDDPNNNDQLSVTGPYHIHDSQDNWGIGVRGGFNVSWYMSKNWSFYGDFAWTTLLTKYDTDRKDTLDDTANGTTHSVRMLYINNDSFYAVKYIGELELGLRWETWFYDDNYHFAIQAGWEEQVWINWFRPPEVIDEASHDLSFHGLNLKFRFDF